MIKVGQIYKDVDDFRFVITLSFPLDVYGIYNNGSTSYISRKNFKDYNLKLIAEYPTWQEAVNSKKFNE